MATAQIILKAKDEVSKVIKGIEGESTKAADGIQQAFKNINFEGIMKAGVASIGVALVASIKAFADFQDELRTTMTMTGLTGEAFYKMEGQLSELSNSLAETFGVSSREVARSFYQVLSAGITAGSEGFKALAEAALMMKTVLGVDTAWAVETLADTTKIFGMTATDAGKAAEILFKSSQLGSTTVPQLAQAMREAGKASASMGISMEETAAVLVSFANKGVKGAEAGTAFRMVLTRIGANQEAKQAIDALGVSIYDASGNMRSIISIFRDLQKAMSGMSTEQKSMTLKVIAGEEAFAKLAGVLNSNIDDMDVYVRKLKEGGSLTDSFSKKTETLAFSFAKLKTNIGLTANSTGELFAPAVKSAIDSLNGFLEILNKINMQTKERSKYQKTDQEIMDYTILQMKIARGELIQLSTATASGTDQMAKAFGIALTYAVSYAGGIEQLNAWSEKYYEKTKKSVDVTNKIVEATKFQLQNFNALNAKYTEYNKAIQIANGLQSNLKIELQNVKDKQTEVSVATDKVKESMDALNKITSTSEGINKRYEEQMKSLGLSTDFFNVAVQKKLNSQKAEVTLGEQMNNIMKTAGISQYQFLKALKESNYNIKDFAQSLQNQKVPMEALLWLTGAQTEAAQKYADKIAWKNGVAKEEEKQTTLNIEKITEYLSKLDTAKKTQDDAKLINQNLAAAQQKSADAVAAQKKAQDELTTAEKKYADTKTAYDNALKTSKGLLDEYNKSLKNITGSQGDISKTLEDLKIPMSIFRQAIIDSKGDMNKFFDLMKKGGVGEAALLNLLKNMNLYGNNIDVIMQKLREAIQLQQTFNAGGIPTSAVAGGTGGATGVVSGKSNMISKINTSNNYNKTSNISLYIGSLVADDSGLRNLEKVLNKFAVERIAGVAV